ncbi:MAG: molybdopterin-dependent oxidoreductase [Deltaproteobacteria bacterium]|jgi:anaerobic selenocysteine-containing dehydrogenase|nr:molybdopterin-dependent oxidoreductase [Deltaproteobacteria bacterium]
MTTIFLNQTMPKYIKTACTRDCPNTCSLIAKVEDDRVVSLTGDPDSPTNAGRVCRKCPGFVKRAYDANRVLWPLIRVNGRLTRASWEDALELVASKISLHAKSDPKSILYYQGFGSRTALKLVNRRFFNLLGPTTITKGTICGGAGQGAQDLDYGTRISHDIRDHNNSRLMILWGRNPAVSSLNLMPVIKNLRSKNIPVVLIDPIRTQSSSLCSWRLAPKPGTDAFLALALARIIFEAGREDNDFLLKSTENLGAYKEIVFSETLEQRATACDIPASQIERLALLIMENKPVSFVLGWGLHRWVNSHITLRSIDALGAVAGSIGRPGGGVSQGFEEYQPYDWSIWGDEMNPNRRKLFMPLLGSELKKADPPILLAFITAGNPVAMLPDSNEVKSALERVPFKVYGGHFLDDTGLLADVFFPATTFLEEDDIVASYGHSYICPINRAIEPLGESKSDFDLFMSLGAKLNLKDYVKPREEWLKIIMAPTLKMGLTIETIREGGAYQPDIPHVPYQDGLFPTPNGKFRLLDFYAPPAKNDGDRRFALMSTAPKQWLCSEIRPQEHPQILPITINDSVAYELGIADGETVLVHNSLGQLKAQAKLDSNLRADLVVIPRGGWDFLGCNVNVLTRALLTTVGQGTAYYESRVDVSKITI